jgi:hypothetical protein
MRTRARVLVPAAIGIAVLATLTFAAAPPAEVVIDDAVAKQGPVKFAHAKHAEVSCTTCHHTNEGLTADSDAKVESCSACHLDAKEGVPSMREMSMSKNPFHDACMSCHKEKAKGPTKCTECHQPKK